MIHTGIGVPFALPSMVMFVAKKYSNVNFILAHAGAGQIYCPEAIVAATHYNNVYLETSWTTIFDKIWCINALGSERILFGSDMPDNLPVEIFQYKNLDLSKSDIKNIMCDNAKRIFKI